MNKNVISSNTTGGLLVYEGTDTVIVGRLMEIIEAIGLPQKQEESVKSLIKKVIYEEFSYPNSLWIGDEFWKYRENAEKSVTTP